MKIKRYCLRCHKEFETEAVTNSWGMPLAATECDACRAERENKKVEKQTN